MLSITYGIGGPFSGYKHLSNVAANATVIETEAQFRRATARYAQQCAKIAVFDLWIGNEDRACNLMASIKPDAEYLIIAFDHGRSLLGCTDDPFQADLRLIDPHHPESHPMSGMLNRQYCEQMVERIRAIPEDLVYEVCDLGDTCGTVMPVDQMKIGGALIERRRLLPGLVERVLFPS